MKRCKVGDLVVVVSVHPDHREFLGRICTIVGRSSNGSEWRLDLTHPANGAPVIAPDKCLRPLREGNGDDETLTWAGKPNELPADVIREVTA